MKHIIQQLFACLVLGMLSLSTAWAADVEWDVKDGYSYSYSGTNNVTLKNRTFAANTWEGLCLPFSVSAETMASVFGEGYNLQEFDSYENNTIKFKKATDVAAGKPYYIKISSAVSDPIFNNVTFGSSLSGWQDVAVDDNISFRGFYYHIYDYHLVDQKSDAWCFWLSGNTLLNKNTIPWENNGRIGTQSFFFVKIGDANTPTPSISFEGNGNTNNPEEENDKTPTEDDDPDADYSHQNDTNDDGVLEPTAENPAFGVKVNYHKYPQKTNVPTIYITTNAGQDISNLYNTKTETYYTANIVVVDKNGKMKQRNEAVTFRGRGNSTWNSGSKKKPWRLKFPSKTKFLAEYDLSAGAEINNYANAKSWTLLSNVYDKSLMRNALTAELGKRAGLEFNPAYRFVDLVINGQYLGTYQVSDQVQVDSKRVNVNSKTGWFVEHSTLNFAEDPYIMPKAGSADLFVTVKNPETETVTASGESKEAEEGGAYYEMKQWLTQYWSSLVNASYSSEADKYKAWRDQTNLKSVIGWMIVQDLAGNYDGGMANVYAYKEAASDKLKFGPLWDLDLAYGNHSQLTGTHFWHAQSQGVGYLFGEMFKDKYFVKALYEKWTEFKNGNELSDFITAKVSELSTLLAQTQAENYNTSGDSFRKDDSGWKIDGSLTLGSNANSYSAATSALTSYLLDTTNGRIAWIEKEYKKQYDALGCASLPATDWSVDDAETEEPGGEEIDDTPIASTEIEQKIANKQQLTNLATVYLTVPDALNEDGTRKDINSVVFKKNGVADYHKASIEVVDNGTDGTGRKIVLEYDDKLNIKVRGNETAKEGVTKLPYRLKFEKDEKDPITGEVLASHKYDLLGNGINGYKKRNWVLLANAYDGTLMHNALAYTIGKAVGMKFCPGYKFVDLVINGEYRGNYQITDHCEVDESRINIDANGWYLESNKEDQPEEPYVHPTGLYISIKNPEPVANSAEETQLKNDVLSYFNSCTALFDRWDQNPLSEAKIANLIDPVNGWRKYWDEESLVNYYIGVNVTGNHDGFMTVKMYRTPGEKIKFGPLWDFDTSYGNYDDGKTLCEDAQADANLLCNYVQKIVKYDPVFVKKIHDRLHEVVDAGLEDAMLSEVNKLETMLTKSQTTMNQLSPNYATSIAGLRTYITTHIGWLVTTIDAKYEAHGGDEIQDNTGGNEEDGNETGNDNEPAFNTEINSGIVFSDWNGKNLPSSLFNSKATSAKIIIKGAATAFLSTSSSQNDNDNKIFSSGWDNDNKDIVFILEGDNLALAKAGRLFVGTNQNPAIVLSVINYGAGTPETPETPETETFEQLTDLPTMYLQIYKLNEDGTSDKTQTETITASGGAYHTARIVIVDENGTIKERDEETEIRGRGNSTWSGDNLKNPYRLKFPAKTKLLSYVAEDGTVVNNYANAKSWTLLSNKGDYSLIRNALTAELGKYMDMPFVPAYKFVDLVINGNYAGTYQISDQIQVAKDRINVNSDTGWLLSANRGGGYEEDPYFTAGGATFNIKNPEADTPTASGVTTDTKFDAMKTWMADALATPYINGANRLNEETLAAKFDMESLANYIIGIDITGDPDGAIDNFYMYKEADESSKMKFGPMWDYDLAYGNAGSAGRDYATKHFFADETYGWGYNVNQMYNTPTVIKAIWKRWKEVYGEYDSETGKSTLTKYLLAKVEELDAIIDKSQAKNFEAGKAGSVAGSNTYATHADAIAALKSWIPDHIEWLNNAYKADYKEITGLDPDVCDHTYNGGKYTSNGDGTYSRECDNCGMPEEGGTKVYKFITYNEDGTLNETFSESKTWATDNAPANPNAIVVVEYGSDITGKNIVVEKNGKYTCANFELTDGFSFYSPIKFTATNATYSRNVSNDWGTICLPYKVQNVEAADATYYQLKSVGENNSTLVFEVATSSGAYTPLVFKRKSGSAITVNATDVTVKATSEDKTKSTVADWTLIGTMEQKKFTNVQTELASDEQLYYIAQNKFWHTTSSYTNNPFRAYFIYKPTNPSNATKSFSIGVADDTATDIAGISNDSLTIFVGNGSITLSSGKNTVVRIFTASGSLVTNTSVGAGESKTINLPSGLYIINGTKVTVK